MHNHNIETIVFKITFKDGTEKSFGLYGDDFPGKRIAKGIRFLVNAIKTQILKIPSTETWSKTYEEWKEWGFFED